MAELAACLSMPTMSVIAARLEPRHEVLPDEACRAGDDHAAARGGSALVRSVGQSLVRKKIGRGKSRMIVMIGHQKRGV